MPQTHSWGSISVDALLFIAIPTVHILMIKRVTNKYT